MKGKIMVENKKTQEYNADQIQVLEGLEAVRVRPGMYIGSTSSKGLHHLVWEIVDNSIDEALAGYCNTITVAIEEGNWIRVEDNGRGIPVDIQEQTGKPVFTQGDETAPITINEQQPAKFFDPVTKQPIEATEIRSEEHTSELQSLR